MKHFSTLKEYCHGINISPPKWAEFDIRSFEENMQTVNQQMPKFKHEFYVIAVKINGGGFASTGNYSTKDLKATVFFNSPYQILSWDIVPDWKGYYIIFSDGFFRRTRTSKRITEAYPYLLIDNTIPMKVSAQEAKFYAKLFSDMYFEFQLNESDSKDIIANYLEILLRKVGRLYKQTATDFPITQNERKRDLEVVSRFKTLLDVSFQPNKEYNEELYPHQVQFYAIKLNLHPNHFNAIVKRITEKSASGHIYSHILSLAKSRLKNTNESIKEIAFGLYYNYPNHFASFFKGQTKMTPSQYRKSLK
ncbi:helix-turn-helix domain-containing protein [Tunicatimonas pelagia]|uniref:helix-turn-helix domain-containing protein n=1 Tax=Tunicatimonas pelagia TaxID=931531 RepID=UPI00266546E2|nr:helix-turn-helix domain-containing protein [Tunicatimonas pelagia]WKN43912.1 helix-turn-helix domain-containing protein [Tunicatimonas pelagia]